LGDDDEVQIVNSGDGAARDVVVDLFIRQPPRSLVRAGDSPVIGARAGYIVDLHAAALPIGELPDGVWVRCSWRNHDETISESWAQQDPEDAAFVETASPLD
jgi:hypothetical protein